MGLAPGTLSQYGSFSFALTSFDPTRASSSQVTLLIPSLLLINTESRFQDGSAHQQQVAVEGLYRDANSLLYADNKPTDEAIDRVIGKINDEYVVGSYVRPRPVH